MIIRNQPTVRWTKKISKSSIMAYSGVFLLTISFLTVGYRNGGVVDTSQATSANQNAYQATTVSVSANKISVDQLSAASAVTSLAEATNLPAAGDLREATTSLYIKKQLAQTDTEVISKPQIVQPTTSSERGVTTYTVAEGETMESIAGKFKVSSQTLRWANNTNSDTVSSGQVITVPLTDGVLYTIKDGDSLDSLADKYKVDAERVILYNDLDSDKDLPVGVQIVLPSGDLPETERPGYIAPVVRTPVYTGGGSSSTSSTSYNYARASVGNRYAAGNCTWYAYERRAALGRPIGSFWGNAYSWASSARAAGFLVNQDPQPGSVFQTPFGGGGYGHAGVVERVDDQNIYVSDMNYAGYNVVTNRTIPRSALGGYNFIH